VWVNPLPSWRLGLTRLEQKNGHSPVYNEMVDVCLRRALTYYKGKLGPAHLLRQAQQEYNSVFFSALRVFDPTLFLGVFVYAIASQLGLTRFAMKCMTCARVEISLIRNAN